MQLRHPTSLPHHQQKVQRHPPTRDSIVDNSSLTFHVMNSNNSLDRLFELLRCLLFRETLILSAHNSRKISNKLILNSSLWPPTHRATHFASFHRAASYLLIHPQWLPHAPVPTLILYSKLSSFVHLIHSFESGRHLAFILRWLRGCCQVYGHRVLFSIGRIICCWCP